MHNLRKKHFNKPTYCQHCDGFIWGIGKTGYKCADCHYSVHTKCFDFVSADCPAARGLASSVPPSASPSPSPSPTPADRTALSSSGPHVGVQTYDDGTLEAAVTLGAERRDDGATRVRAAVERASGAACVVTSHKLAKINVATTERSIQIQRELRHAHVVRLLHAFNDGTHLHVVTEDVPGGQELFDVIQETGRQTEADCQRIVRQLCEAVKHLHAHSVAHRNLKPENILVVSDAQSGALNIKVTGFGAANIVSPDVMLQTLAGTPDYIAPEVLRGEPYGLAVDIWAIGVVTYILLCGFPPFFADNLPSLYRKIMEAKVKFDPNYWSEVSDTAANFIVQLLASDPADRLTASQCLEHPWLASGSVVSVDNNGPTEKAAADQLASYNAHRRRGTAEPYQPSNVRSSGDGSGANGADESSSEYQPPLSKSAVQRGDGFTRGSTEQYYKMGEELGKGGCATVYRATELSTGQTWALKRLVKEEVDAVRLEREIAIMKQLNHPSILQLKEAFDSDEFIDLIIQLADGGELFEQIIAKGHFCEEEAADTVCQLVQGLRYMHSKQIAHRDLKPENILVHGEQIKIADFGLSNIQKGTSDLKTPCGTPDYVAPEVLANKGYTLMCDMWSAGVITFIILCGHPPFWDTKRAGLYKKIQNGQYDFTYPEWKTVSDVAKDFVRKLMTVQPKLRYTADQALAHAWLVDARAKWAEARKERKMQSALASVANLADYTAKLHEAAEFKYAKADPQPTGNSHYAKGHDVTEFYTMGKELGRGGCGVVYLATDKRDNSEWALKRILKKDFDQSKLERELSIMAALDHPRILHLRQAFDARDHVDLIIELAGGGELFDLIISKGHFSERDAAQVIRQMCEAIGYLHERSIAHRDLKPENVLLVSKNEYNIKIADFGLSNILDDSGALLATACGTPDYVAPEVLRGEGYSTPVDMWAIGVLTYILLCGYPPFYDKQQALLFQKIMAVQYRFHENEWKDISEPAKDFIRKLLVEQPVHRSSARQALRHPWLKQHATPNPKALRSLPTSQRLNAYKTGRARGKPAAVAAVAPRNASPGPGRNSPGPGGAANGGRVQQMRAGSREDRAVQSVDDESASSTGASNNSGSGGSVSAAQGRGSRNRGELRSTKAAKGLQKQLMASKAEQQGQSKRDKSYQIVLLGSKYAPTALSDGYELKYQHDWLDKLLEFIKLEQRYHQRAKQTDWVFELAFHHDTLLFRVRGSDVVKAYLGGVLKSIGKL